MILSGGQTGVDRAALDAAWVAGLPTGGWCPAGRWAEDGPIPPRYSLRETPSADPTWRTRWNVRDAEATLIVTLGAALTGGTAQTVADARALGRPYRIVDLSDPPPPAEIARWLGEIGARTLNVAGPRGSEAPGIAVAARCWLATLFERLSPVRLARLDPAVHGDALWAAGGRDPVVWRFGPEMPPDRAAFDRYLHRLATQPGFAYAVLDRESGVAVGVTALSVPDRALGTVEIGGTWLGATARGRGFNQAAKAQVLRLAFEDRGVEWVVFRVAAENRRAARALIRLGVEPVATAQSSPTPRGPAAVIWFRLSRATWERRGSSS